MPVAKSASFVVIWVVFVGRMALPFLPLGVEPGFYPCTPSLSPVERFYLFYLPHCAVLWLCVLCPWLFCSRFCCSSSCLCLCGGGVRRCVASCAMLWWSVLCVVLLCICLFLDDFPMPVPYAEVVAIIDVSLKH